MKRVIAIADRAASVSLKLLVALNVLFFLSFLAVLLFAAGKAHAEIPTCTGADMLSALQKERPGHLSARSRRKRPRRSTARACCGSWKSPANSHPTCSAPCI